ncbi:hypothetical protein Q7C36_002781 [Tachysurus vachellii]|uniref:Peroxiredoxin-like 2A n=1 Tax=Tachysurus vachellii TaxID=175792 RepID=A0AA88NZH2_TACVA|nr:hypothetical protein Q7C36_002781 [Tachysurus vachellii]
MGYASCFRNLGLILVELISGDVHIDYSDEIIKKCSQVVSPECCQVISMCLTNTVNAPSFSEILNHSWFKETRSSHTQSVNSTAAKMYVTIAGFNVDVWLLVVALITAFVLMLNTDLFLTKQQPISLNTLANAELRTTAGDPEEKSFKALTLWEKSGAVIMAEASELSSLKPQLDDLGVPLYAVVKENVTTEIHNFRPYFSGEIFLDEKQFFYSPSQRKIRHLGLARINVWKNILRAWRKGYHGNMKGEGFILGGIYVIGPDNQGILMEHQEKEFGDKADLRSVLQAVKKVQKAN